MKKPRGFSADELCKLVHESHERRKVWKPKVDIEILKEVVELRKKGYSWKAIYDGLSQMDVPGMTTIDQVKQLVYYGQEKKILDSF